MNQSGRKLSIDPSESLTIDHEIDIKPVRGVSEAFDLLRQYVCLFTFCCSVQEIVHSADEEEEYTPLTCDMCSQTFNRPSDWVRHIEFTHADMTENRRKRRKVSV